MMRDDAMRKPKAVKVLKGIAMVIVMAGVVGFVVRELWNWLMPGLFGLHTVTFWQALGLFVLGKLLLGGFHRHANGRWHGGGQRYWRREMRDRWEGMSEEERERFQVGMRRGRGCGWGRREDVAASMVGGER